MEYIRVSTQARFSHDEQGVLTDTGARKQLDHVPDVGLPHTDRIMPANPNNQVTLLLLPALFVSADPDGWAANGALAHMAPEAHLVPPMHLLDLKAF